MQNYWLEHCEPARPRTEGIKWDVFISYRSLDRIWALALYDMLVLCGYEVFMDQFVLVPGNELEITLGENLRKSASGVLIWSKNASDSSWIKSEFSAMSGLKKERQSSENSFHIVVATLDKSTIPGLAGGQIYIDFSEYPEGPMGVDLIRLTCGLQGQPPNEAAIKRMATFEQKAKEEPGKLRALAGVGKHQAIAEKIINTEDLAYTTSSTLSGVGIELLINGKEYELALETLGVVMARFPKSVRLKQLNGLALRRNQQLDAAHLQLNELYQAGHRDTETLGILASVWADKWENLLKDGSESDARDALERSRNLYLEGFNKVPHDYYTGINAASKSAMLGDLNQARVLADQVLHCLNKNKEERGGEPAPNFWERVTEPEAYLLKGEWEKALTLYHDARIAHLEEKGSIASTGKQVSRLLSVLEMPKDIASKIKNEFNL